MYSNISDNKNIPYRSGKYMLTKKSKRNTIQKLESLISHVKHSASRAESDSRILSFKWLHNSCVLHFGDNKNRLGCIGLYLR